MAGGRRAYVVRDSGSPSRMGRVYKVYSYTLKALLQALDDARFRSFAEVPQLVVRVDGRQRTVIRWFEHGREDSLPRWDGTLHGGDVACTIDKAAVRCAPRRRPPAGRGANRSRAGGRPAHRSLDIASMSRATGSMALINSSTSRVQVQRGRSLGFIRFPPLDMSRREPAGAGRSGPRDQIDRLFETTTMYRGNRNALWSVRKSSEVPHTNAVSPYVPW